MEQLDSAYPLFLYQSEDDFFYDDSSPLQIGCEPLQQQADTNPQQQSQSMDDRQSKEKRSRDNNTIFKTPLSEFRKVMLKKMRQRKMSTSILSEMNKKKNNSTFLKFLILAGKLQLKKDLQEPFKKQMTKVLLKKKAKLSEKRYEELQKVYERMCRSIECDNIDQAMRQYWGQFRQKQKFQESEKQIKRLEKKLETICLQSIKRQK